MLYVIYHIDKLYRFIMPIIDKYQYRGWILWFVRFEDVIGSYLWYNLWRIVLNS
jgi:hypothetical protein